ncbi:MAG: ATP-grasp domain-containing protein [Jatrophihabitans sp.]|uniref:ATP-grasp domain-containing protein n=1 Tax=Jatrophihabitans sp. TaxID=1932789 RepID=UPI003F806A92
MAIVTLEGDLHAYVIQHALATRHGVEVAIVAADRIPAAGGLSWSSDGDGPTTVPTEDGGTVDVAELDLVWWRRCHGHPEVPDHVTDRAMRQLVIKDGRAGLRGTFLTAFRGTWLSDPYATERAQNKLVQLELAQRVGLTVPRTLISSDPARIREFVRSQGGRVVAKTLTGVLGTALEAGRVELDSLTNDAEMQLSPTVYQAEVPGTDHLRVMVFGERVHAARISSNVLDWRLDGDKLVEPVQLPADLERRLIAVVVGLGLRMGVFDLKITPSGEPVFLEVNPQGQFLFVEGMCGMPLGDAFADFAADELARVRV